MHVDRPPRSVRGAPSLRDAIGLGIAVWTALALGGAARPLLGRDAALIGSFGLAAALCAVDALARAAHGRHPEGRRGPRRRRPRRRPVRPHATRLGALARFAALAVAGGALAPGIVVATLAAGAAFGLPPRAGPPTPVTPFECVASLVLAPWFEEHLYRGRLLAPLAARVGGPVAVLVSSAAFALPHLTPRAMLGAGLAGSILGARWLRTRRTADCVALHLGLNAAGLASASGTIAVPSRSETATALGIAACLVAVLLLPLPIRRRGETRLVGIRPTPSGRTRR